jgi:hypothetical protein
MFSIQKQIKVVYIGDTLKGTLRNYPGCSETFHIFTVVVHIPLYMLVSTFGIVYLILFYVRYKLNVD